MIDGLRTKTLVEPGDKIPRVAVAAIGRPAAEKQRITDSLRALHGQEIDRIVNHVIRLYESGAELHRFEEFTENMRRSHIPFPPRIEVDYDFIEVAGTYNTASGNLEKVHIVYVPFHLDGEYLAVKYYTGAHPEKLGDFARDPQEVLYAGVSGEYRFQYFWGEEFEPIRRWRTMMVFDADAPRAFADQTNQTLLRKYPPFRDFVANQIKLTVGEDRRVLSVGLGQGELEEARIKQHRLRVEGVDISPKMAEEARAKGITTHVGDAHELTKLVSGMFDAVVFPESLGYFLTEKVLDEARAVLAPNGQIIVITYPSNPSFMITGYKRFPVAQLRNIIEGRGFQIETCRGLIILDAGIALTKKPESAEELSRVDRIIDNDDQVIFIRARKFGASA